jgi:hypothetical protein
MNTTYDNGVWLAPKPSRAERKIPRKSSHHFVGELTFGEEKGQGQCLGFESKLEHDVALIAIYRNGVTDVREQVKVVYNRIDGRPTNHFFDFVTTENGRRTTALIVKPHDRAIRFKFRDTVSRVAAAAIPSIVDRVTVVTERVLDPDLLARVEQFHSCRFPQPKFDAILAQAATWLVDFCSIKDFLDLTGLGRDGFHGVIRLMRFNALEALQPGMLTMSSLIRGARKA